MSLSRKAAASRGSSGSRESGAPIENQHPRHRTNLSVLDRERPLSSRSGTRCRLPPHLECVLPRLQVLIGLGRLASRELGLATLLALLLWLHERALEAACAARAEREARAALLVVDLGALDRRLARLDGVDLARSGRDTSRVRGADPAAVLAAHRGVVGAPRRAGDVRAVAD